MIRQAFHLLFASRVAWGNFPFLAANAANQPSLKTKMVKLTTPPNYIGVWKHAGQDFRSVQYLSLYPDTKGDMLRGAAVQVDDWKEQNRCREPSYEKE